MMIRLLLCLVTLGLVANTSLANEKPNIIYVLADDLGYGDLSCYGQETLVTPHIDKMASEGMRFTRHYSGSTVCAPSRCVLLTGMHTGHATVRGNGPGTLKDSDFTIAELLKQQGYKTGCVGKWGVGNPPPLDDPARNGFDYFYGYINMFHAHNCYPEFVYRNGKKVPLDNVLEDEWKQQQTPDREGRGVAMVKKQYVPDLVTEEALKFIERNQHQPFFLYYALNVPHANNEGRNDGMEVPDFGRFTDKDWPKQEKGFASMIHNIDRDMGRLLVKLKELKLDEKTIVFFASDNGPHQEGGHKMPYFDSNGDLRGMKRDMYEGGVRVPMIVRWPGKIKPNSISHHISAFQDILPTLASLSSAVQTKSDGISLLPTLLGNNDQQQSHKHLYWEFSEQGGKQAVLKGKWKAVRLNWSKRPNGPLELYDLLSDEPEATNVASQHPQVVAEMAKIMEQEHTPLVP